jgi:NADPH:quinone reductase-like Zn-dependent oxidoreductase
MKAIVYNKKASPEKLVYGEVERPTPNDKEVLVSISAVSPNAADYRSIQLGIIPKKKIFGSAISGTVVSIGKGVQRFKPGDNIAINGSYSLLACRRILHKNGTYVMVGGALSQIFKTLLFGRPLSLGAKKIRSLSAKPNRQDLEFVTQLAAAGIIKPLIEDSFSLEKTVEAMRYLAEGHARGKLVIKVA